MRSNRKPNLFLTIALVLFCLVLVSVHFASGFYARFSTRSAGNDVARAAGFRVSAEMSPGTEENAYVLQLRNDSEAAVSCTVEICFDEDFPTALLKSVILNGEEKALSAGNSVVFDNVEALAPRAVSEALDLKLEIDPQYDSSASNEPDFLNDRVAGESGTEPFTVRVLFTQLN